MAKAIGSEKTGGRKKGTPNKKTLGLEAALEKANLNVIEKITELIPQLSAEKQVDTLMEMMSYLYPKRKAIETISEASIIHAEIKLTEEEASQQLEQAKEEAMSLAKKLVLLDQSTEEIYIRGRVEEELKMRKNNASQVHSI